MSYLRILCQLLSRSDYEDATYEQVDGHNVYILTLPSGEKQCAKILFGEEAGYEGRYIALAKLGVVPGFIEFIRESAELPYRSCLLVTKYVEAVKPPIEKALEALDILHAAGYVHGDLTTAENVTFDGEKALFYDIDYTFHVSKISEVDIDLMDEFGTTEPCAIQAIERRCLAAVLAR